MVGLILRVFFGRFSLAILVWFGMVGWSGFFYEEGLKKPLVPFKVAKASLELHLETILVWSGPGRSNRDIKADSVQLGWSWD